MSIARTKSSSGLPVEYKIVVVGSAGVGKSALSVQFVHTRFLDEYDPTIEDTYQKQCVVDDQNVLLEIFDTAGLQDYSAMRDSYMQKGDGFLLVFSVDSRSSFQEAVHFQEQILRIKDADTFPMVLVGNKSDLDVQRQISISEARELANSFGCRYIEATAKGRHNVEECFYGIVREIRKYRQEQQSRSPATLRGNKARNDKRKSDCNIV